MHTYAYAGIAVALILPSGALTSVAASPKYPKDAVEFRGHHYKIFWARAPWPRALAACAQMGGHLACIDNGEEQEFLAHLKGKGKAVWLGARRVGPNKWEWIDGKPLDVKHLKDKHPPLGYDYVGFHAGSDCNARPVHGYVKSFPVQNIQGFICEWDE